MVVRVEQVDVLGRTVDVGLDERTYPQSLPSQLELSPPVEAIPSVRVHHVVLHSSSSRDRRIRYKYAAVKAKAIAVPPATTAAGGIGGSSVSGDRLVVLDEGVGASVDGTGDAKVVVDIGLGGSDVVVRVVVGTDGVGGVVGVDDDDEWVVVGVVMVVGGDGGTSVVGTLLVVGNELDGGVGEVGVTVVEGLVPLVVEGAEMPVVVGRDGFVLDESGGSVVDGGSSQWLFGLFSL